MTDQILKHPTLANTEQKKFNLWEFLTLPHSSLKGDHRRKAFSLAALSLFFIPLALFAILAPSITNSLNNQEITTPTAGAWVAMAILIFAYALSRTKHYQIGAYMIISTPYVAVILITLPSPDLVSDISLFYMSLGIILASLLLTANDTIFVGIVTGLVTAGLYFATEDRSVEAVFPTSHLVFAIIATTVMALISRIRERNLKELEIARAELAQRVIEVDEARQQAEHSNEVKSVFLASMSHELRTPLNAIINFTRFVVKGTLGPVNESQVETLDNVIVSGRHLLNLINDVLDMSKIESGSLNLFVSDDVEIDEIVDEVYSTGRALLDEKDVEFRKDIQADLPNIVGDQQRIRQIMLNLVSNACKFTEEGHISITAKQQHEDIIISVADTGPGIAAEDQHAVFEAFKQTETGLRQSGGTGLGMPITKSLVEAHGGEIYMDSTVGQGTTFTVRLPIKSTILTPTLLSEV